MGMMTVTAIDDLAYLTAEEPGIGGRIKRRPEDFFVDELPLFEPTGSGDHLYLKVEKNRRLTTDCVRFLAEHFNVPPASIGYAGLKDKHAVTRQWFSIEHADEDHAFQFENSHVRIVDIARNDRKLQRGNLRGNRFHIKVRDVDPAAVLRAQRILRRLTEQGAPNFIGHQRFGYRYDNHLQGMHLLLGHWQDFLDQLLGKPLDSEPPVNRRARQAYERGDYTTALETWPTVHRFERQALGPLSRGAPPEDAVNGIDRSHRQLLVSAFQSAIFNELLNQRLKRGGLGSLELGDICFKHETRGKFEVYDPDREQPRADQLEISPTGPMWGPNMMRAGAHVADRERQALHATGVTEDDLASAAFPPHGSRRPFRMPITDPDIASGADDHGPYITVSFSLPRGSFATIVMRELMKPGR